MSVDAVRVDAEYSQNGQLLLAGIDEAGRGPLAGPVVAAAVVLPAGLIIHGVRDSKKVPAAERSRLFKEITARALCWSYSFVSPLQIDAINILQASLLAMKNCAAALTITPQVILLDGNKSYSTSAQIIPLVKGDSLSQSIGAASIIAKVLRDEFMEELHYSYPEYGWIKNKGYPTQAHIAAVRAYGATPFHRQSFLKRILDDCPRLIP